MIVKNNKSSPWKSIQLGLAVMAVLIVYAYGFEITQIDLEQLQSEQRQTSLQRVMRALARPDILEYDKEEQKALAEIFVPCPESEVQTAIPNSNQPYITISPACAEPESMVTVEGYNFLPNASGPVRFVPGEDPKNVVELGNDIAHVDTSGHFVLEFKVPNRTSEDRQFIRATIRRNIGFPHFTKTARDTWDKIIETVFLALLATTIGTILAIPISFLAARNLMKSVRSPLAGIALSIIGWPVGIGIGYLIVNQIGILNIPISADLYVNTVSVVLGPLLIWFGLRWAMPQEELRTPKLGLRLIRLFVLILVVLAGLYTLFQLAALTTNLSIIIKPVLGPLGFLATFLFQVSAILRVTTPAVGALVTGGALSSLLGRIGQYATERGSPTISRIFTMVVGAAAGATIPGLIGWLVEWLYQIGRPEFTIWLPVLIGAGIGLIMAVLTKPKDTLPIGLTIYYITRSILNGLRSVEALVMAIVFVIAVGIGPFAGVLALGLHTIVSLAKLYSEQVESILPGPLEAVEATGANRLQTVIYAVIPQIVPPYISYTMYRWDINVRMSTIIGFVGGGGIGFLLLQNINLLNYRAASAQMLAIAIVVASMDYISSVLREKYV